MFSSLMFTGLMANTWIAASIVAVIAGLTGFFAVLRGETFAAHAIPNGAFAGAAGASLLGINVIWGLAVVAIASALGIGALGSKARHDVVTALTLVLMLGLGALFVSVSNQYAQQAYSLLFGEVFGVSSADVPLIAALGVLALAGIGLAFRPLMLTSAMPEVAQARGISVRGMEIYFLVVMALATSMTVPVVGALLMFSLMIGPAAAARSVTARPGLALVAVGRDRAGHRVDLDRAFLSDELAARLLRRGRRRAVLPRRAGRPQPRRPRRRYPPPPAA